jgi:hypothetical protein
MAKKEISWCISGVVLILFIKIARTKIAVFKKNVKQTYFSFISI